MRINKSNVSELWELYECYKQDYKRHSLSIKEALEIYNFEEFVDNTVVQCSNCKKYFNKDEILENQLSLQDIVCDECIENGYGR